MLNLPPFFCQGALKLLHPRFVIVGALHQSMQPPSTLPEPFLAHPQLPLASIEPAGSLLLLYAPPVGQHEEPPGVVLQQREHALKRRQPLPPLDAGPRLGHRKKGVTILPEFDPCPVSLFVTLVFLDVSSLGAQGTQVRPQHQRE